MKETINEFFETYSEIYAEKFVDYFKDFEYKNLTISQLEYLGIIDRFGKITITELSNELNITKSSATTMTKRLESMQLIRRISSEEDKRVTYVALTENAHKIIEIDKRVFMEISEMISDRLSNEEQDLLTQLLKKSLNK